MRDNSLHCKRDGRVFQMRAGYATRPGIQAGIPIPFSSAKHNYTRKDINSLDVGQSMTFIPMFGNRNPVCSELVRLK